MFDIDILMRKLFLLGAQPSTWKIIDELHQNTKTCVKWKQQTSETFSSHQGVKQGGLLSAELRVLSIYFFYDDGGIKWGCICCKTSLQWRLLLCQYVLKLFLAICSSILHSIGRTTIPL
jgi:hypothetical protein